MFVTAEPIVAVVDAVRAVLTTDPVLLAGGTNVGALTGVFGHLSEAQRTAYPYLVIGERSANGDAGAMTIAGHKVTLEVNGWSDAKGAFEIETIGSRVFRLLERRTPFVVPGFSTVDGSLHREYVSYFEEPDEDSPDRRLWRMTQRWTIEIHDAL